MAEATHEEKEAKTTADTTLQMTHAKQEGGRQKNEETGSVAGSPSIRPQQEDAETGQSETSSVETYSSEEDSPTTLSDETKGRKELQNKDF